jgi:hypothetical protein
MIVATRLKPPLAHMWDLTFLKEQRPPHEMVKEPIVATLFTCDVQQSPYPLIASEITVTASLLKTWLAGVPSDLMVPD